MNSFRAIIDSWPNLRTFAEELGVTYVNAQVMYHRDSVSSKRWADLVPAAQKRGIPLSYETLAAIKANSLKKQQKLSTGLTARKGAGPSLSRLP